MEAMNLMRAHLEDDVIHVESSETRRTKSGKWRVIPLNKPAKESLAVLLTESDTDFVYPRVNPRSLSRACENDLERAKLPGSIHWLRHSYITHQVMSGLPLRAVQVLAGHSRIETTERYAHVIRDHLTERAIKVEL